MIREHPITIKLYALIHKGVGMFSPPDSTIHHYFTTNALILTMPTQQILSQGQVKSFFSEPEGLNVLVSFDF